MGLLSIKYELGNTTLKAIHEQAKVNISVFTEVRRQGQGHKILCWSGSTHQCLQTHQV